MSQNRKSPTNTPILQQKRYSDSALHRLKVLHLGTADIVHQFNGWAGIINTKPAASKNVFVDFCVQISKTARKLYLLTVDGDRAICRLIIDRAYLRKIVLI